MLGRSATIAHDANGNMTLVPTSDLTGPQGNLEGEPVKVIWDAWNRLRKVLDETDQIIWENHYDALTRRIITDDGTTARHYYYNDQWRCVEERLGSSSDPERQYVWNPSDRWDLILRGRDTTTDGTLDEDLYCLKDDLDPVAIAAATGQIVERYAYSAFGMASILTPGFEPRPGNQSDFGWNLLFHAEFQDQATGWMNYGYRYYAPELGRWLSRDPIGEEGGVNLYGFVGNGPLSGWDLLGLDHHHWLPTEIAEDIVGNKSYCAGINHNQYTTLYPDRFYSGSPHHYIHWLSLELGEIEQKQKNVYSTAVKALYTYIDSNVQGDAKCCVFLLAMSFMMRFINTGVHEAFSGAFPDVPPPGFPPLEWHPRHGRGATDREWWKEVASRCICIDDDDANKLASEAFSRAGFRPPQYRPLLMAPRPHYPPPPLMEDSWWDRNGQTVRRVGAGATLTVLAVAFAKPTGGGSFLVARVAYASMFGAAAAY